MHEFWAKIDDREGEGKDKKTDNWPVLFILKKTYPYLIVRRPYISKEQDTYVKKPGLDHYGYFRTLALRGSEASDKSEQVMPT